ncbi:SubName: Full=Uncharacterized protein {ECO:0000313/EMBL:CCA72546.1} [Serendipita indica DSM 11827]|nr:SubName: Full=Uncharacterized protein {ECO:0000313/EMBL:CCA72546.1} [Serendipita indica DSM 11827]
MSSTFSSGVSIQDFSSSMGSPFSPAPSDSAYDEPMQAQNEQIEMFINLLAPSNPTQREDLSMILTQHDYKGRKLTWKQVKSFFAISKEDPRFTCGIVPSTIFRRILGFSLGNVECTTNAVRGKGSSVPKRVVILTKKGRKKPLADAL